MKIELTFQDFLKWASNGTLEKDDNTITFTRPVLSHSTVNIKAKTGEVRFYLDDTDPKHLAAL